jgi:hypothetical protein
MLLLPFPADFAWIHILRLVLAYLLRSIYHFSYRAFSESIGRDLQILIFAVGKRRNFFALLSSLNFTERPARYFGYASTLQDLVEVNIAFEWDYSLKFQ